MEKLHLVSGCADRELDRIRKTVASFESVSTLVELIDILGTYVKRDERIALIDATGHTRSPGFLVLGNWVVDDSPQTTATFSELLRPQLALLGVRTIRLLGCATAGSERALGLLCRIASATRCRVFGARGLVSADDYGSDGFIRDDVLWSSTAELFTR